MTPNPEFAIPVSFAIALHTAKIIAISAIISMIIHTIGQAYIAPFSPICAVVCAQVAPVAIIVAAATNPFPTAITALAAAVANSIPFTIPR